MSVYVTTHVWHNSQHKGTALLLVLALADQANDEGVCWPSVATLAHKTRLSERSVQNLLAEVLASSEVVVLRESQGGHSPRVFRVVAPPAAERPPIRRGAKSAPLPKTSAPGVQNGASRGADFVVGVQKPGLGVQISTSRGEAGCTQTVINRHIEPSLEPDEPSRACAREGSEKKRTCSTCGRPASVDLPSDEPFCHEALRA